MSSESNVGLAFESARPQRKPARFTTRWSLALTLSDLITFTSSAFVGIEIVDHLHSFRGSHHNLISAALIILLQLLLFERLNLYRRTFASSVRDELYYTTAALVIGALPLLVLFTLVPALSTSRVVILTTLAISIPLVGGSRAVLHELRMISEKRSPRRIAIVGLADRTGAAAMSLNAPEGTEILRIATSDIDASVAKLRPSVMSDLESVAWFAQAREWGCDLLLLTETLPPWLMPMILAVAAKSNIKVAFAPPRFRVHAYTVALEIDGEQALIVPTQLRACTAPAQFLKRVFDLVVAIPALVIATPILACCALALRIESRGPIFFRQARVGLGGRVFDVLKLRSMSADAERGTGPRLGATRRSARHARRPLPCDAAASTSCRSSSTSCGARCRSSVRVPSVPNSSKPFATPSNATTNAISFVPESPGGAQVNLRRAPASLRSDAEAELRSVLRRTVVAVFGSVHRDEDRNGSSLPSGRMIARKRDDAVVPAVASPFLPRLPFLKRVRSRAAVTVSGACSREDVWARTTSTGTRATERSAKIGRAARAMRTAFSSPCARIITRLRSRSTRCPQHARSERDRDERARASFLAQARWLRDAVMRDSSGGHALRTPRRRVRAQARSFQLGRKAKRSRFYCARTRSNRCTVSSKPPSAPRFRSHRTIEQGGVVWRSPAGDTFLEDVATLPVTHVLSGGIVGFWGIFELQRFAPIPWIGEILGSTIGTLQRRVGLYDSGYWSYESALTTRSGYRPVATLPMHDFHIAALRVCASMTGDAYFNSLAEAWSGHVADTRARVRVLTNLCRGTFAAPGTAFAGAHTVF